MMSRERRTGDDRLTSTSVHLPCAYLDSIIELKRKPSEYIRDAVGEKLERDEGFATTIQRLVARRIGLEDEVKNIGLQLDELREKNNVWRVEREEDRIRDLAIEEYVGLTYQTADDLLIPVRSKLGDPDLHLFGNVKKYDEFVRDLVHDVWCKAKDEKVVIKNGIN